MASFFRSDINFSTPVFNGRAGSAASAVDRLIDAKHVTQLSAVIGNEARDSALQINGHVADKINSLNFKYLIIPCHCEIVRAVVSTRVAPLLPSALPVEHRLLASAERSTHFNTVEPADISSLRKEKQNMTVFSKATGRPDTFCAIRPPKVRDNFISLRIIKRLGLETHFTAATVVPITWDSTLLSSTGDFVDLSFPDPSSAKNIARRFYVMELCPFDMLLGTNATGLPSS